MKTTTNPTRHYDFHLPVFKQGDDLGHHLAQVAEANPTLPTHEVAAKALQDLAVRYEEAAALSRRMAAVAIEVPGLTMDADCHCINVSGPPDRLDVLVGDILAASPFEDEVGEDEVGEDADE